MMCRDGTRRPEMGTGFSQQLVALDDENLDVAAG
jgi:hypothetical protein